MAGWSRVQRTMWYKPPGAKLGENSETVKICEKSNVKIDIDMTKFDDFHDKQVLIVPNIYVSFVHSSVCGFVG